MDSDDHVPPPRFFDRYSSSSSNVDESRPSLHSTNRRLDCMIQFLDRKLSTSNSNSDNPLEDGFHRPGSLPEFVGRSGGQGIFRLPDRCAVRPKRPPSLEIRSHPLRETQVGRFLRTIVTTERHLWAGSESGAVRVLDFRGLYGESAEGEEEDAALFKGSST